jgi:hypothetical protein
MSSADNNWYRAKSSSPEKRIVDTLGVAERLISDWRFN